MDEFMKRVLSGKGTMSSILYQIWNSFIAPIFNLLVSHEFIGFTARR